MANENPSQQAGAEPTGEDKPGRRRYYRKRSRSRRRPETGESQSQSETTPAPQAERGSRDGGSGQDASRRRSRRNRRRRSRKPEAPEIQETRTPALENEDREYVEPTEVFIYTYVVRPGYRDFNEYVPERFPARRADRGSYVPQSTAWHDLSENPPSEDRE